MFGFATGRLLVLGRAGTSLAISVRSVRHLGSHLCDPQRRRRRGRLLARARLLARRGWAQLFPMGNCIFSRCLMDDQEYRELSIAFRMCHENSQHERPKALNFFLGLASLRGSNQEIPPSQGASLTAKFARSVIALIGTPWNPYQQGFHREPWRCFVAPYLLGKCKVQVQL